MPPRYAYWTIIVDDQPTAFRSGSQEELMPTFKRLKAKNGTAVMMWFQNGKLWPSRIDAQEAMRARGEMGRRGDERQAAGGFRDRERRPSRDRVERTAWTPRGEPSTPAPARTADDKLDWKPKGEFVPAPKRTERKPDWKPKAADRDFRPARSEKPEWRPKGAFTSGPRDERPRSFKRPSFKPSADDGRSAKPEWKPKGSFDRERKPDWKPKSSWKPKEQGSSFGGSRSEKPEWKPKGSFDRERKPDWKSKGSADRESRADWEPKTSRPQDPRTSRPERPEWRPKGASTRPSGSGDERSAGEKRKWVPKEEYKKSIGIEAKRDSKWRPGGEHKDPRQKYKDAKKAKWTKFKQNIRSRSGGKGKKSS
jgi:hypothetical protein